MRYFPRQIVREGFSVGFGQVEDRTPSIVNSPVARTREYLTGAEVEALTATARKSSRHGHRDATMILIAYRHGLRASELCDLQWHQVELNTGRLHVRRSKRGTPSVHPMQATRSGRYGACSVSSAQGHTYSPASAAGRWTPKSFCHLR